MANYGKMNPALKAGWVAALRSGKYRQTQNRLAEVKNKRYSYCCLGVLCNLDTKVERVSEDDGWRVNILFVDETGEKDSVVLPHATGVRLGISEKTQDVLTRMNDEGGKSFAEIADWVEENL